MMKHALLTSFAVVGLTVGAFAQTPTDKEHADLAKAMTAPTVAIDKGLTASEREGTPISAKFEMHEGKLQLSVYTMKAGKFYEVVQNPTTGAITKSEAITDKQDLVNAAAQNVAMGRSKTTLRAAVEQAVKANSGYTAVSAYPGVTGDRPTADITLMQGTTFKSVTEKLD